MARPRSDDKRSAIISAAVRIIALNGLGAATATIAKEAGVSNGSLFTYFETKTELFNQLYLELKAGMASAALEGLPPRAELHDQVFHMWSKWMGWAISNPDKRRALAQLDVSDEILPATRAAGHKTMLCIGELLALSRAEGALREAPMAFVVVMMNSVANATIEYMVQDPTQADRHSKLGFDAFWRMIA